MKWDNIRKQYYLEKSDVTLNTIITEEDMRHEYGDNFEVGLRMLSDKVYDYMDSVYRGVEGEQHALAIRKMIYDSSYKQTVLMDAMLKFLDGALTTGMDLREFTGDGKPYVPENVETKLRKAGLIIKGNIDIRLEELQGDWS